MAVEIESKNGVLVEVSTGRVFLIIPKCVNRVSGFPLQISVIVFIGSIIPSQGPNRRGMIHRNAHLFSALLIDDLAESTILSYLRHCLTPCGFNLNRAELFYILALGSLNFRYLPPIHSFPRILDIH